VDDGAGKQRLALPVIATVMAKPAADKLRN
jgi:hypothetical protein